MKLACLFLALAATAVAQDIKYYRLDFTLKELEESRVVSAKKYTVHTSTDEKRRNASIRAGTKVPFQTTFGGNSQVNYADVGVNIDVTQLRENGGQLTVEVQADISSVPAGESPTNTLPVVRQNRWNSLAIVEPGKPTTLVSSDDLNSKRKIQLEVVATAVK